MSSKSFATLTLCSSLFTLLVAVLLLTRGVTLNAHNVRSLWYNVPIAWPFAGFVLELTCAQHLGLRCDRFAIGFGGMVIAISLLRVYPTPPGYSGHVLFLTYAILCAQTTFVRVSAGVVLLQVLVMKFWFFHDFITPCGGVALALIANALHRQARRDPLSKIS